MFDSRHIRTFQEVVRTQSYTAAARTLGYTQPAITQQMKALERAAGTPLFTRAGRGLRLTDAGETLARHTENILGSMSVAWEQMTAIARLRTGRVRVCAFPSANATLIPEAMALLAVENPGIRVELLEDEPPDSLRRVAQGESDLTLAFTYPGLQDETPDDLVEIPLLEDQLTVLLPVGHPMLERRAVKLADLAEERWIAGCPRCRTNLLHECAQLGFVPDIMFTIDDILTIQSLVAHGLGVAMMPGLTLSFLRRDTVMGRSLSPTSRRRVSAYVLREHLRIPATARVLEALSSVAGRKTIPSDGFS
ncbi:LysR family transcriptional regulator [Micromonospora sp. NBC_00858]|uniref:LysR family transcriptional regulator n=1 Tax=Micromonospora sp. NBC_00858 TaxID=2975979 RepID=UPI00386A9FBC|nr:LysR family transcriptional regulator [Micromonospora sp. NBC_00858]